MRVRELECIDNGGEVDEQKMRAKKRVTTRRKKEKKKSQKKKAKPNVTDLG